MPETQAPTQPAAPQPDLLQTTLTVPVGNDKFEFRIPSLHDEIKIGGRVAALRRMNDPAWDGFTAGLDGATLMTLNACATFEVLLERASAQWCFTPGADGKPYVDSSKFPTDKVATVLQAYGGFDVALTTFRQSGFANQKPVGAETVASQPGS